MKEKLGIFIDLRNERQVEWWNEVASKLVDVITHDYIMDTKTNQAVGILFALKPSPLVPIIVEYSVKTFLGKTSTIKVKL